MAASIMQKPKEKIALEYTMGTVSSLLKHTAFWKMSADIIPSWKYRARIVRAILSFDYEGEKERKRKGQLGTIKLLSWKGQTHCESIYRQSYLAFTRGWFHYLNVWPPYHTIATPTLVPREKEKEREEENKFYLEVFGSRALFRCRLCPCDVVLHTSQQW